VAPHNPLGPTTPGLALAKGFYSKGFYPGRNSGQSGEAFSRLLQGPSPAVHTNHTGQSSGEVKSIPHQVGQATGERSREVNRQQRKRRIAVKTTVAGRNKIIIIIFQINANKNGWILLPLLRR